MHSHLEVNRPKLKKNNYLELTLFGSFECLICYIIFVIMTLNPYDMQTFYQNFGNIGF